MSDANSFDNFQCTVLLNSAVQQITIEMGVYLEEVPYYKASMPDGRTLYLNFDEDDLLWHLESGEVTEESEAIGNLIIERYIK